MNDATTFDTTRLRFGTDLPRHETISAANEIERLIRLTRERDEAQAALARRVRADLAQPRVGAAIARQAPHSAVPAAVDHDRKSKRDRLP